MPPTNPATHTPSYTVEQFNAQLSAGAYAWPGGYPVYFITSDGAALSFNAAKSEAERIRESMREASVTPSYSDGWVVVGCEVNWEDPDLFCDHTGARIESAYAEDRAKGQGA